MKKIRSAVVKFFAGIFCLLLWIGKGVCVSTQIWEVRDFKECRTENIVLKERTASIAPEIKTVWKNPEVFIWAIYEKGKELYVGTGGGGKIYRSKNKSDFELFYDTQQAVVFSIAEFEGKIYAGTSPNGIIYVIDKDGKGEIFNETGENYIWSLVFDEKGVLYTGTGITGKILRITKTKVDTFYEVQEPNISVLYKDMRSDFRTKNYFYAGTGEKGRLFKIDKKGNGICIYEAAEKEIKGIVFMDDLLFISATGDTAGAIYCIKPDNKIEKIWEIDAPIRALQRVGNSLLVGAGKRVFKIERAGIDYSTSMIAEFPFNITCMKNNWIGTSELGNLYVIQQNLADKGIVESKAYDVSSVDEWGRLEYEGKGKIAFFTRTGNTSEPDKTWNEWLPIPNSRKIKSPYARFIQWKAELSHKSHYLKSVKVFFLPQNSKPQILSITFEEPNKNKTRKIVWSAEDSDKDSLIFNLYFKLTGEKVWTLLKPSITDTFFQLEHSVFPDGIYEFKVECSDSLSNSVDYFLKNEKISEPYIIDNTGPSITITEEQGKLNVKASDKLSYVKSCEYSLDGGNWIRIFPVDKIFDSKDEEFSISAGDARKIVIRIYDSSDNVSLQSKLLK